MRKTIVAIITLAVAVGSAALSQAVSDDTTADRVFGQPGFLTGSVNTGGLSASSLQQPDGMAIDAAGRLFLADAGNKRVLEYDSPLTSSVASRVYGQPNFTTNACTLPTRKSLSRAASRSTRPDACTLPTVTTTAC